MNRTTEKKGGWISQCWEKKKKQKKESQKVGKIVSSKGKKKARFPGQREKKRSPHATRLTPSKVNL